MLVDKKPSKIVSSYSKIREDRSYLLNATDMLEIRTNLSSTLDILI